MNENLSESQKVNQNLRKSTHNQRKSMNLNENQTKSMQPKPILEPWDWFRPFAGMRRVCAGQL